MSKYFLDSNIFIYHLCDDPKIHYFFSKLSPVTDQLFYSFISSIELLGYSDLTYPEREKIDLLLNGFKKVGMNNDVEEIYWNRSGLLFNHFVLTVIPTHIF